MIPKTQSFNRSHFGYKSDSFEQQLKMVLKGEKYDEYSRLNRLWRLLSEKTTISVYPVFCRLSKLFSSVEWLGKYGGLKEAYEIHVPRRFIREYRRAMYSQSSISPVSKLKSAARNIDEMSQSQIDDLMEDTKAHFILREETFYFKFPIDILEDWKKCQKIWSSLPYTTRKVLCFDEATVAELGILLRISPDSIQKDLQPPTDETSRFGRRFPIEENTSDAVLSDFSDIEMDEETQNLIKKFKKEVLDFDFAPELSETSEKDEVFAEKSEKELVLAEKSEKRAVSPKEKEKKKKGPRKGRRNKNRKVLENSAETEGILLSAFGNATRRSAKGSFFLPAIRAEEEIEKRNAKRAVDFAENFNEGDFVPDVVDDREIEMTQSFLQPQNLEFLNQYNATQTAHLNQNANDPFLGQLPPPLEPDKNKGFFDQNDLKMYDFAPKDEKRSPVVEYTPANEQQEFEIWERSLLKNARLRERNNYEIEKKTFIDPETVGATNFDSRGEYLSNLFNGKAQSGGLNASGKVNESLTDFQTKKTIPKYFMNWVCICGKENNYKRFKCFSCNTLDKKNFDTRLKKGILIEFSKKKGLGFVKPLSAREPTKYLKILKGNIWSSDNMLYENEKVVYRSYVDGDGKETISEVIPSWPRARRMMVGDCVELCPKQNFGWIQTGHRRQGRSNVFFHFNDYDSGQTLAAGMVLRFELDFAAVIPRAIDVKPYFESAERYRRNSFVNFYTGTVVEWKTSHGFVKPDNGEDNVMADASAAMTKDKKFAVGQRVEFSTSDLTDPQTGRIVATHVIKIDPPERFHGLIGHCEQKYGFIEPSLRWKTGLVFFHARDFYEDIRRADRGTRVCFSLKLTERGVAACEVEVGDGEDGRAD